MIRIQKTDRHIRLVSRNNGADNEKVLIQMSQG